jgi:hypothetical protein
MDKKKRPTKAEIEAARAREVANSERLLTLAERAEAGLPPHQRRPEGVSRSGWLRHLMEKAQAELDARK